MPAPISAQVPSTLPAAPCSLKSAPMMGSLVKNPENGGMPMMARYARPKVTEVIGITRASPPYRRMFTSSFMPCMTDPAPRNRPALKNPWASSSAIANT